MTERFIESRLAYLPVLRIMSNTPVLVDEAMSVISVGHPVGKMLRTAETQQRAATRTARKRSGLPLPPVRLRPASLAAIEAARGRGHELGAQE
jgi:hypothetical protein